MYKVKKFFSFFFPVRYRPENLTFDSLEIDSPHLKTTYEAAAMTKWIWLNDKTFVVPSADGIPTTFKLIYVTLFHNDSFSISVRQLDSLRRFVMQENTSKIFQNYFGNFFIFPKLNSTDPDPSYFYFATHCPKHYKHSRLLFVSRDDLKIIRYLDLPGMLTDLALDASSREFFIALDIDKSREFNSFVIDGASFPTYATTYSKLTCFLDGPWISKSNSSIFLKNVIFKMDEKGFKWETSQCHNFQSFTPPGYANLASDLFRITYFRNTTAYSTSLIHLTRDFIIANDDQFVGGKEISRRHHFHSHIAKLNHLFGPIFRTFRHPTKPISCIITGGSNGFNIYLDEWAESNERKLFPSKKFHYKAGPVEYSCADEEEIDDFDNNLNNT